MKDVVLVLHKHVGDGLSQLLLDLEASESAYSNQLFAEFLRRIRKASGITKPPDPTEPKPLLDLLEKGLPLEDS